MTSDRTLQRSDHGTHGLKMDQRMAAAVRIERNQQYQASHRREETKSDVIYEDTEEGDIGNEQQQ